MTHTNGDGNHRSNGHGAHTSSTQGAMTTIRKGHTNGRGRGLANATERSEENGGGVGSRGGSGSRDRTAPAHKTMPPSSHHHHDDDEQDWTDHDCGGNARPGELVDRDAAGKLDGFNNRELMYQFLRNVGEDPEREGLQRTPYRVEKAWDFITSGYRTDVHDFLNNAVFSSNADEMVLVKDIQFYSMCEHHLLPFTGVAHVAYLPAGKVVGLSKLPRIVDMFARRLQIQEQLTMQIADCVNEVLQPRGVAVVLEAVHFCMMMRGVQKQHSRTVTSAMLGDFREQQATRDEFMRLIHNRSPVM